MVYWLVKILGALGIFLIIFLLRKFLTRQVSGLLKALAKKSATKFDDYLIISFEGPINLLFAFLGLYLAALYLPLSPVADAICTRVFRSLLVFLVAKGFYNLAGNYNVFTQELSSFLNIRIEKILVPFITKILRFLIIALAIVVILQEWNYSISGFIAGLGLGGLAFALAAQQTLANLFGGIVIITDKPFDIGDRISTPSVEGTVEDINFRSTRIRTADQAVITVPNSTLANEPITNWSRMGKRRIAFSLGIPSFTPKNKLEKCLQIIREMLNNHPGVHPDTILVNLDTFKDGNLEILFYFFTKTTVWDEYLQVKEDINLKIMSIFEQEGIRLAYPVTSVNFVKQPVTAQETEH